MTSPDATVQEFPPTLREVMLRPQWLALLGLCLVVAGVFAWLGQWQLGRAIDTAPREAGATENVVPLDTVVEPGTYLAEPLVGQRVSVEGSWVPGDFLVISSRFDDGREGFWVAGQLRTDAASPTSLAVAVGWTDSREEAERAASALSDDAASDPGTVVELTGRLIADEGPALPGRDADPQEMTRMSPAALVSRWNDTEGVAVYRAYLTSAEGLGGLGPIHSPPPGEGSGVNWLNIFYAAEWAVFAGFAFYLWYRLARDAWERETEELAERAA